MSAMTKIIYNGELVAVVLADQAILANDTLPEADERTVKAMCLYALEIDAGVHPGPYSDEKALEYARRAERARIA